MTFGTEPPEPRGWAMEARVIAEDPARNFMPSVGRIERVRFPQGPGVRNDAGFYRGYTIPIHYDSLLSKLVAWGRDREQARRRLLRALGEYVLEGPHHNLMFHRWLVSHPEFAAGRLSTRFIEEHFKPEMLAPTRDDVEVAILAAALHAHQDYTRLNLPAPDGNDLRSPWKWVGQGPRGRTR
jgi:acetyl/propionyl-CoA carboxylase alpha subunit